MFGVLGALTGARRGPAGTIVWCRFTKVIQGVISNTQSAMMAVIVRSNMCRGFPQAVRMDYSGFDVGDGLPDHLADPVDVPVRLLRRLVEFAVGGFLWDVIIPLPT